MPSPIAFNHLQDGLTLCPRCSTVARPDRDDPDALAEVYPWTVEPEDAVVCDQCGRVCFPALTD